MIAITALMVTGMVPLPAGAATSHQFDDPRGDVEGEAGRVVQPEADIVRIAAERSADQLLLKLWTDRPTDPGRHPAWTGATLVLWGIDVTGDDEPDFLVSYYRNDDGEYVVDVDRTAGDGERACQGANVVHEAAYTAVIPAGCIGDPQPPLRYAGAILWDTDPNNDDAPVVGDTAPDDGLVGPVDGNLGGGYDDPDAAYRTEQGGYWLVARDGGVFSFGSATFSGSAGDLQLNQPIVGMAPDPDGRGYWFVAADGGIFAYDAPFYGSTGAIRLNKPIVGMAATPTGKGYWLVASDGGVFSFGDARFFGSTGDIRLNSPIVGMAPTPSGDGYWFVSSDGGIFSFGRAHFYGSMGGKPLNRPIVGMTAATDGRGYWLLANDGGIFSFGTAGFHGSGAGSAHPAVGMSVARDGQGYSIVRSDGSVANLGSAPKAGSLRGKPINQPMVAIATAP